jgi:RNA polymerase sigma-70 factor (ECF subfamily)
MSLPPHPAAIPGDSNRPAASQLRPHSPFGRGEGRKSRPAEFNSGHEKNRPIEFFSFDADYIRKLTGGDAATEQHFVSYFETLLFVKLRYRLRSREEVEELRQEVFLRVLRALRQGTGVRHPERFGAFVNSVCNNLVLEHYRQKRRATQFDEHMPDRRDSTVDLEGELLSRETRERVRALIGELSASDRGILRAVLLEERDKDEVCRELGVDRGYLRVLLHRARSRFRLLITRPKALSASY